MVDAHRGPDRPPPGRPATVGHLAHTERTGQIRHRPGEFGADDATSAALDARSVAASPGTDPAHLAIRAERAADLRAAVAGLQEPYREVVGLRFFGELSLEEIARQTERPVATIKTHLRRGLLQLRGVVEPRSDA